MKNKKLLLSLCILFFAIEAILGYYIQKPAFLTVNQLQFTSIVIACIFCLLFIERSSSYLFTQLALIFTVCADYFLALHTTPIQLQGMICFSVVQAMYFLRLFFEDENISRRRVHLILRTILSLLAVITTVVVLGDSSDLVATVSVFYYTNLVLNLVFSFIQFKKASFMAIGFVFFLLCDTVIGFASISPYFSLPESSIIYKFLNPGFDPAWACYVPSQILLSMSLLPRKLKNNS